MLVGDLCAVAQEQGRQQDQLDALLHDVAILQHDRDVLAEETGVSQNVSGVDMYNRVVELEKDCDHSQAVTNRLERYVEEMLRTMLGTLDQGRLIDFSITVVLLPTSARGTTHVHVRNTLGI